MQVDTARSSAYTNGGQSSAGQHYFGFPVPGSYGSQARFDNSSAQSPSSRYGVDSYPPPDAMLDAYRYGIGVGNGPGNGKTRNSTMLDTNDPVTMHLLVETAMGDSHGYEILSFEEVEDLKKQEAALASRIDGVRRKLALESKVRDAAASLNRLYTKKDRKDSIKGTNDSPRSSSGSAKSGTAGQTEDELAASNKKCEDLGRDLYLLEIRQRQAQNRLLRHTAGILQMTHKGPSKNKAQSPSADGITNGVRPDSPASIYTYENSRRELPSTDDTFDDRSFYQPPDNLDRVVGGPTMPKSGEHMAGDLNAKLHDEALLSVERRLEELNESLRSLIVEANPERNHAYAAIPLTGEDTQANPDVQLDYLEQGLRDVSAEQQFLHEKVRHSDKAVEERLEAINLQMHGTIQSLQSHYDDEHPAPPAVTGQSSQGQLHYLEESFYTIETLQQSMQQALNESVARANAAEEALNDTQTRSTSHQDKSSQYEAVLSGLWAIMLAGEEESRQRKRQRRAQMANDPNIHDELSPDEDGDPDEPFTIQAFSTKVQHLYTSHSRTKEKQGILRRQIKQQRELGEKADQQLLEEREEYQRRLEALNEEVVKSNNHIEHMTRSLQDAHSERDAAAGSSEALVAEQTARRRAEEACHDAEDALDQAEARKQSAEDALADMENELAETKDDARIAAAEAQARLSDTDEKVQSMTVDLAALQNEKHDLETKLKSQEQDLAHKQEELKSLEEERERFEGEVVRLTTDLTIAKAELDGAYGTRAQRAAEVAANPEVKSQLEDLTARNIVLAAEIEGLQHRLKESSSSSAGLGERENELKRELTETLADFEELTRASVECERERESLEQVVDQLRDKVEGLEVQLGDERVRWLGVKSPGGASGTGAETTSVMVLRNEFKKMIRETRADGVKALRAEQEERRKLEAVLRQMRKDQVPGKSRLGQSMSAS